MRFEIDFPDLDEVDMRIVEDLLARARSLEGSNPFALLIDDYVDPTDSLDKAARECVWVILSTDPEGLDWLLHREWLPNGFEVTPMEEVDR